MEISTAQDVTIEILTTDGAIAEQPRVRCEQRCVLLQDLTQMLRTRFLLALEEHFEIH